MCQSVEKELLDLIDLLVFQAVEKKLTHPEQKQP